MKCKCGQTEHIIQNNGEEICLDCLKKQLSGEVKNIEVVAEVVTACTIDDEDCEACGS